MEKNIIEILFNKKDQITFGLFLLWAIILPWSLAGMQIIMVLLVLSSIVLNLSRGCSPIKFHPFYIFIGLYLLSGIITIIAAENSSNALISAFNNDWVIVCVPFIASIYLPDKWKKKILIALLISATISGLYGMVQFFDGFDYIRNRPISPLGGFFRSSGGYSSWFAFAGNQLFVFAFAFTFALFPERKSRLTYLVYFSALIIFLAIIGSQTRSIWLGIIFVILLGTFIKNKKYFLYAIVVLFISGVVVFLFIPEIQSRFTSIFSAAQNEGRLNIWHTSYLMFKDNWLVGVGHGNFDFYFEKFKVPGFYDAQGHAHNDYLNVAVLNGILGFLTWIGMWIAWFYYAIRAYRLPERTDIEKNILLSAILGISGILVAAIFQCYYTDLENNILWWVMVAVSLQISIQSKSNKTNKQEAVKN